MVKSGKEDDFKTMTFRTLKVCLDEDLPDLEADVGVRH